MPSPFPCKSIFTFFLTFKYQFLNFLHSFKTISSGLVHINVPLDMCMYLLKEQDYVPWAMALQLMDKWKDILQETSVVTHLNYYLRHILSPMYNKLGWSNEGSHNERLMRGLILTNAVNAKMPEAKGEALKYFKALKKSKKFVPPDFRWIVYSAGVRYGSPEDWNFAFKMYNSTQVASERSLWLKALASSNDPYILQQYLDMTLDKTRIRTQDVRTVIASVASNPSGTQLTWRFVQMHWEELLEKYGEGSFAMGSIIESVIGHFSNEFDYEQVKDFFTGRKVGSGKRALEQSMEKILINIHWRKNAEDYIKFWTFGKFGLMYPDAAVIE